MMDALSGRVTDMRRSVLLLSLSLLCALLLCPRSLVSADKFEIDYRRELGSALVFGEPKFVRAIGMYADRDSAWGNAFSNHPAFIQLRLYASELSEQLRTLEPAENILKPVVENSTLAAHTALLTDTDFQTSDYSHAGFIQATILQAQDLDLIGMPDPEAPMAAIETYCCTPFYVDSGMCAEAELGSLIIDRNVTAFDIWTYDLPLMPRQQNAQWTERRSPSKRSRQEDRRATYHVRATGEHVLILSHCDPTLNTEIAVSGMTEWKNPYGYLPGRLFGFLNFHRYMLMFYVLFGAVWMGLNIKHWKDFSTLQAATSVVIFLCMAEQITWYTEYTHFNQVGERHIGVVVIGILLSCLRQTVSRMLIVAVALGYKIVKPSLGDAKLRLAVLGGVYFVLEAALELVVRYQQTHPLNDYYRILLTLPVSVLNATFYWWIFIGLYTLMQHLEARSQEVKFALYRSFSRTLLVALGLGLLFSVYQSYYMLTNQYAWHWSYLWLVDGGFALMLYSGVLVAIAVLFRPTNMANRFAYAALDMQDEEDEEATQMTKMAGLNAGVPVSSPMSPDSSS